MTKILLVEDDPDVRQNIQDLLEAEDYGVLIAENGLMALDILENTLPDLILCDVMMPGLDGHGLLKWISNDKDMAGVPFIFLTARADNQDQREGMNIGADDYLTKPFTREQLLTAIGSRLQKVDSINKKYLERFDELRASIAVSLPHELRTPLTGIMGFSEYLIDNLESTTTEEVKEYLLHIYASGKRLNRLVENYIAFSELQVIHKGGLAARRHEPHDVPVMEFLLQVAQTVAFEHEREHDLSMKSEEVILRIPEKDFEKICIELIDNAFRFSKAGQKVHVTVSKADNRVNFQIRDHGIGMTPRQIDRMGGFVQLNREKHEQQGSGLGFTIAQQLIMLLKGGIDVESKENYGTTVNFWLPLNSTIKVK